MSIWLDNYGFTRYGLYGACDNYGSLTLTDSSPAQIFTEVLDLDTVKSYLKIPQRNPSDPIEDATLNIFIVAARIQAEVMQNRDLVRKSWDLTYDFWPSFRIRLRDPLKSVDLITTKDNDGAITTLNLNTDFIMDATKHPGIITPPFNGTWPAFSLWPSSSILIRFQSGYDPTDAYWSGPGAIVKNAMLLLISSWYNGRIPFEQGAISEYPFAVTQGLGLGALERVV